MDDAFARGLVIANNIAGDPRMQQLRDGRYSSFDSGDGKRFEDGELDLTALRDLAAGNGEPEQTSAKQELVENLINEHMFRNPG